jgi:hypothetical protein
VLEGYWCELGASPKREWWLGGPKHPKMSSDNLFTTFTLPLEIQKALRIVTGILQTNELARTGDGTCFGDPKSFQTTPVGKCTTRGHLPSRYHMKPLRRA